MRDWLADLGPCSPIMAGLPSQIQEHRYAYGRFLLGIVDSDLGDC